MKKNLSTLFLLLLTSGFLQAQSLVDDALRYSHTSFGGTARGLGLSGAVAGLGADVMSMNVNPAGLGFYRKSEFSLTPNFHFAGSSSTYYNNTVDESNSYFNVNSFGVVFCNRRIGKGTKLKALNYGFGYNRLLHFNGQREFRGYNDRHSLTEYYADQAQGFIPEELGDVDAFGVGLAWDGYLFDEDAYTPGFYNPIVQNGGVEQSQFTRTRNAFDEYAFSVAGNYNDLLYFGLTLGVPSARYNSLDAYQEEDINDIHGDFERFSLRESLEQLGSGINAKLGVTARVAKNIRAGASVHLPYRLSFQENYSTLLQTTFTGQNEIVVGSPNGNFEYDIKMPLRAVGGVAVFFGKKGFLSADYEFVNHRGIAFSFDEGNADDVAYAEELNFTIDDVYKPVSNVRVGGEFALKDWRFRAGYALYSSPYELNKKLHRQSASAGVGFRKKGFFMDLAYVTTFYKGFYQPYTFNTIAVESVETNYRQGDLALTFGVRF